VRIENLFLVYPKKNIAIFFFVNKISYSELIFVVMPSGCTNHHAVNRFSLAPFCRTAEAAGAGKKQWRHTANLPPYMIVIIYF
jgi:hypothetical protein